MHALALLLAGVVAAAPAATVNLAWDAVPDARVTGYEVGYGSAPGAYSAYQPAPGTTTTLSVPDSGATHIAVRALGVDAGRPIQSGWSNEVVWLGDLAEGTRPLAPVGLWARIAGSTVMAAPTFVAEYVSAWNSAASPKTLMNAVSINAGDVIVMVGANEGAWGTTGYAPTYTENGSASLANATETSAVWYAPVSCATYVATGAETLTTTAVRGTNALTSHYFGGNAIRFSGSDGVGAIATGSGESGAPSFAITTTQANSAIVVVISDWNATSGTQTFTSTGGAGSATALSDYPGDNAHYGVAIAYYADAGTAGSKTVGMSAPSDQKWRGIAIEVKGTAGGASASLVPPSPLSRFAHLLVR